MRRRCAAWWTHDLEAAMRNRLSTVLGFGILTVLLMAGTAQSLAGSNTVFSDDIVDGTIGHADVKANSLGGSRILNNAVTGADVNEATLVLTCKAGLTRSREVCYGAQRASEGGRTLEEAFADCLDDGLRLPSPSEARMIAFGTGLRNFIWADGISHDGTRLIAPIVSLNNVGRGYLTDLYAYHCVTSVGARP